MKYQDECCVYGMLPQQQEVNRIWLTAIAAATDIYVEPTLSSQNYDITSNNKATNEKSI